MSTDLHTKRIVNEDHAAREGPEPSAVALAPRASSTLGYEDTLDEYPHAASEVTNALYDLCGERSLVARPGFALRRGQPREPRNADQKRAVASARVRNSHVCET